MNSLNSILLEGNVVRDPDFKQTPKGTNVCTFSLATNRFYHAAEALQKEVSFFDVECWNGVAERCSRELKKGRGVRVVGRLKQERWTDQKGQHQQRIKIVAEHVEFKPVMNREAGAVTAEAEAEEAQDAPELMVEEEEVLPV